MRNRLLIFGRFSHDPQSILTGVSQLALVGIKRGLNGVFGIGLKLQVAMLAYADYWRLSHDPQFALQHEPSLAHLAMRLASL